MAEYRQGVGPQRLPQGAAKTLNQAQPSPDSFGEIPVQFAPPADAEVDYADDSREDEDMQVLLSEPDAGYMPPAVAPRQGKVPRYVVRHLPSLMAAATQPDAPPTLRALYRATIRQLEDEIRRGG